MSPDARMASAISAGFPRVSGDEPPGTPNPSSHAEFSPRERG